MLMFRASVRPCDLYEISTPYEMLQCVVRLQANAGEQVPKTIRLGSEQKLETFHEDYKYH